MDADALFLAWKNATATNLRPVSAKAHADTLLEVIQLLGIEPKWRPWERRVFLRWCEAEGLIPKKQ